MVYKHLPTCIFLFSLLYGTVHLNYKGCREYSVTLTVSSKGFCHDPDFCLKLKNCTTLYGNLVIRHGRGSAPGARVRPYFPNLREITGYLVIGLYDGDRLNILPSLSVIRGLQLIHNYAFVIYYNQDLKEVSFSSLTTILHGGVRVDRNYKLCYVDGIRWKSIVQDHHQDDKVGIVIQDNNQNCDTSCATGKCKVVAGHGNDPNAQHCWGPGSNASDSQCQRFCNKTCGLRGCVDGSSTQCCHEECLGGCAKPNTTATPCHACKHYRVEKTGQCVRKCPSHLFLVNNLTCEESCPKKTKMTDKGQFSLNGVCVVECPAGYKEQNHTCQKCSQLDACPKICKLDTESIDGVKYYGAVIRMPHDIIKKNIGGCTVIVGNLTIQLKEGTGFLKKFSKELESLREIRGHLKIHKTATETMNLFPNLDKISPEDGDLIHKKYAVAIYDNSNLKKLWIPKTKIRITNEKGMLFAKSNPQLCPEEINKLWDKMDDIWGNKIQGKVSKHTNGHQASCSIKQLKINVTELKEKFDPFKGVPRGVPIQCIINMHKCVKVIWSFQIDVHHKNIIFFTIYYRRLKEDEEFNHIVGSDYIDTENWESVEVNKGKFINIQQNAGQTKDAGNITKIVQNVVPNGKYAFYLKEVGVGKNRFSKIHFLRISRGKPSQPMSLEASFLSGSSIHLTWKEPSNPNGEIVKYTIYWRLAAYSYWEEQKNLDWCERRVKLSHKIDKQPSGLILRNTSISTDRCDANFSCICSDEKEEAKAISRESYEHTTRFKERFNEAIFTKQNKPSRSKGKSTSKSGFTFKSKKSKRRTTTKSPITITKITTNKKTKKIKKSSTPKAWVSGKELSYTAKNLDYFQDYIFTVCACTEDGDGGGCTTPMEKINQPCATTQARTDFSAVADNLDGDINVTVDGSQYNITWKPPIRPNAIVLKYEIRIDAEDDKSKTKLICHNAKNPVLFHQGDDLDGGTYVAKVRAVSPAGEGAWSPQHKFYIRDSEKEKGQILVVGVSVGCAVIVVFMFAIVLYYALFQRNIEKGVPGVLYASVNPEYLNSSEVYIEDEWELDREKIELLQEIGQGSFGMVYEGIAHDIGGILELRVAVKTVNEKASIRDRIQFLQEASIMKAFMSNHVTRLIGVVSQGQPTFVVMELMTGDLQSFLRNRRPSDHPNTPPLVREEMVLMAAQIADGMAYLSARKYVHRDLAARNCFVANDRTVKIGDFGLARDIYETDYYRKGGKGLLPVRWMAPESLKDGIFTTASDVWSYGVVIWEIVTYALQPYQGKSNEELLHYVSNGGCLRYPDNSDPLMQKLMELSWQREPKLRPSFLEIIRMLEEYLSNDFVSVSFYHEMKRKALEDTMRQEGNLHELLGRPNSAKSKKRDKSSTKQCGSVSSIDSGAYIENCKPEADQTPDLGKRKSLVSSGSNKEIQYEVNDPLLAEENEDSLVDQGADSDVNMTYGDTPVLENHDSSSDEGSGDLKISKIFFGKPVPV